MDRIAPLSLAPIVAEHAGFDQGDGPGVVPLSPLLVIAEHVGDGSGAVPPSCVLSEFYSIVSYQLVSHSSLC